MFRHPSDPISIGRQCIFFKGGDPSRPSGTTPDAAYTQHKFDWLIPHPEKCPARLLPFAGCSTAHPARKGQGSYAPAPGNNPSGAFC